MTMSETPMILRVLIWLSPRSNMALATLGSVRALISSGTVCMRRAGSSRSAQANTCENQVGTPASRLWADSRLSRTLRCGAATGVWPVTRR